MSRWQGWPSIITGLVLIGVGTLLVWGSGRPHLSRGIRDSLEVQANLAIPAGVMAIAYGTATAKRNGKENGAK